MRQSDTHNLPTIPLTLVVIWPIHSGPIQQHRGRASAAQGIASRVCATASLNLLPSLYPNPCTSPRALGLYEMVVKTLQMLWSWQRMLVIRPITVRRRPLRKHVKQDKGDVCMVL